MFKFLGILFLYAIASLAIGFWIWAADPFSGLLLAVPVFVVLVGLHYALTRP